MSSPVGEDSRVIGLVGTLSGSESWKGDDAFEGADVAIQLLNRSLKEDESPFELVTRDDGGDPAAASQLVQELASDPRTVGVIYAGPTQGLPPAEVALADAGLPAFALYGDLYGARLLQPHLFQVAPPYLWQARRIARYLLIDRGYRSVGALFSTTLDGKTAASALAEAVRDQNGRLTAAQYSLGDPRSLATALRRLRADPTEALVVQGAPSTLSAVVDSMRDIGSLYRSTQQARLASARPAIRRARLRNGWWRPQLVGFDLSIYPQSTAFPAGTVASETYARGAHYLPVPSFDDFRQAFVEWWGTDPLGLERRSYEAARMIGWGERNGTSGDDRAEVLEGLRDERFGGLDVTFGPDDHTSVAETTLGLWVVPRDGLELLDVLPGTLTWAPLSRGFSIDGRRTSVLPEDWASLFRDPPPPSAPAPFTRTARFGVTTPRSDPIH